MADNDDVYRCPLCGKIMNEDEAFCSDCREIANNSYPNEFLAISENVYKEQESDVLDNFDREKMLTEEDSDSTSDSENGETDLSNIPTSKQNKKLIIFVLIGAVLLVLIGGIGSYVLLQNKNAEETQELYWDQCISENTPLSYSKYLVQYPEGKYSELAQAKIMELRENERKEWNKLRKTSNIETLFAFLRDHPDTPYSRDIRRVIDSLSWISAYEANTKDAYLAYIENSKLGRYSGDYVDVAQQKYDYLNELKTIDGENLDSISKIVTDFFNALSSVNGKNIQRLTVPLLSEFYGSQHQENKSIADSIDSALKKNKIRKIAYLPDTKTIEAIQDNKGIYFITLPVIVETTFTDKKKKKEDMKHTVSIELNKEKLIRSVDNIKAK